MINNNNNINTNVLKFDSECSVDINDNIYCLHPMETNFIVKTIENNNIKYYLNIYNNYNSITSYKQFDLSSNDINNPNYETNKFYLGVNIGNYILDVTDTSGALIDMEGNSKNVIDIFGNNINKYYDKNNVEYLENEFTYDVISANSDMKFTIRSVFTDKIYINYLINSKKLITLNYQKLLLTIYVFNYISLIGVIIGMTMMIVNLCLNTVNTKLLILITLFSNNKNIIFQTHNFS